MPTSFAALSFDIDEEQSDGGEDDVYGGTLSQSRLLNSLRTDFRRLGLTWEGKPDRDTALDHHPTFLWVDMQCVLLTLGLTI